MHALRRVERLAEGRKTSAKIAAWSATGSKQVVQGDRIAALVFFESLARHPSDDIALLGKALLPGLFVCYRCQNLRRNRILLILWEHDYLLQRLFEQRRHAPILSSVSGRTHKTPPPTSNNMYALPRQC